jgi:uncharacterized protein YoxC
MLINAAWYAATLITLVILLRFIRYPGALLALLWAVGLIWGGLLAHRFSHLLFADKQAAANDDKLQGYLDQTQAYQVKIRSTLDAGNGLRLEELGRQVDVWTQAVTRLVQRLNSLRHDEVIRQDMRQVPQAIAELQTRLAQETDPALLAQLERTLANRQKQHAALQQLEQTMIRAEFQIESTLSMLGTIYSQLLTGQSTSQVANHSRLAADVDEEVRQLQDYLEALREVKLGQL